MEIQKNNNCMIVTTPFFFFKFKQENIKNVIIHTSSSSEFTFNKSAFIKFHCQQFSFLPSFYYQLMKTNLIGYIIVIKFGFDSST